MGGDFGGAVEQSDRRGRGDERQGAAQGAWGHGIIVEVEADAESFIGVDGARQVARKGMSGQRQQARFFFGEDLGHRTGVVAGPGALMSDLVAPLQGLAVEISQGSEGASGEETGADVLNRPLHAAFGQSCQLHLI